MEEKQRNPQEQQATPADIKRWKRSPYVGLAFDLLPLLIIFLASQGVYMPVWTIFVILFSPLIGLIKGVEGLCHWKRFRKADRIIAVIAVLLPPTYLLLLFTVVFPAMVRSM